MSQRVNPTFFSSGLPTVGTSTTIPLTAARSDSGAALTTSAGSGAFGISNTTGTSLHLNSETAKTSTVTDKALWVDPLSSLYQIGQPITVTINANYTLAASASVSTATIAAAAYSVSTSGVYGANLISTSAQPIVSPAADYSFVIPATSGLEPGDNVVLEVTAVLTETGGQNASTQLNSVRLC